MKISTKIRIYVFSITIAFGIMVFYYLSIIKHDDRTTLDKEFGEEASVIISKLKSTDWGKTARGRKILNSFNEKEFRVVTPHKQIINGKPYYVYGEVQAASGLMSKEKGAYRIYIGVYHSSALSVENIKLIEISNYTIPEDEFIHILIDELVSRAQRGVYFVDGEASNQEEVDAWNAAEEAVKAYYGDTSHYVMGMSSEPPAYGKDNKFYREIQ